MEHAIQFCELYQNERNELKEEFEKNAEGIQEKFTLMKIVLSSDDHSEEMRKRKLTEEEE